MTKLTTIYDAFFAKMTEDEWENWEEEEVYQDLNAILKIAITWFKFPRVSLDIVIDEETHEEVFKENLSNTEIQIIACYMKCEWLNRVILTWENIKPLYDERDFSQANLLDKFIKLLENERTTARLLENNYYRTIDYKPFPYTKLSDNG